MKNTNESTIIASIAAESKKINEIADAASAYIKQIEKQLLETDVGVTVWGPVLEDTESHFTPGEAASPLEARKVTRLGIGKVKSKWGFAVLEQIFTKRRASDKEFTVLSLESVSLLRKSDRDIRILAMPHIPELLTQILDAVTAKAAELMPGKQDDTGDEDPKMFVEASEDTTDYNGTVGTASGTADAGDGEEAAQLQ